MGCWQAILKVRELVLSKREPSCDRIASIVATTIVRFHQATVMCSRQHFDLEDESMRMKKPPSQRPVRQKPEREVKIGIVPDTPTLSRVGVFLTAGELETLIPPDEARSVAAQMELNGRDRALICQIRDIAESVPGMIRELNGKGKGKFKVAKPRETGCDALEMWMLRHRNAFQAGFREAVNRGYDPKRLTIWAHPETESMDDPPPRLYFIGDTEIAKADRHNKSQMEIARQMLDTADLDPAFFLAVASNPKGRFKGTVAKEMEIVSDDEQRRGLIAVQGLTSAGF